MRDLLEREFSTKQRKKDASKGKAMPDGSFPIENAKDLKNAQRAVGRAHPSKRAAVRRHIAKRAKALGISLKEDFAYFMEEFLTEINKEKVAAMPSGKQREVAKRLGYTAWDAEKQGKIKKAETATKAEQGVRAVFSAKR